MIQFGSRNSGSLLETVSSIHTFTKVLVTYDTLRDRRVLEALGQKEMLLESLVMVDSSWWHGRRVLLTGHTGFKGSWLVLWLTQMGVRLWALEPEHTLLYFNNCH